MQQSWFRSIDSRFRVATRVDWSFWEHTSLPTLQMGVRDIGLPANFHAGETSRLPQFSQLNAEDFFSGDRRENVFGRGVRI